MARDARIDAYIERQAEFARPILKHLREAVHSACPEAEEGIKWGMPHFLIGGRILAGMGAFKAHATFGFWRGREVLGEAGSEGAAMGQFGRLASIDDLPPAEELHDLIRRAAAAVESRPAKARAAPKPTPQIPADLEAALAQNPGAKAVFDAFAPSCRREYVEWIVEAKRAETRASRLAQAVEWMAEGKKRNWKYQKGC
ncbi:MAG TPA: YdeI/OmpD-associated family protein [Allosphingosinicella sp.]